MESENLSTFFLRIYVSRQVGFFRKTKSLVKNIHHDSPSVSIHLGQSFQDKIITKTDSNIRVHFPLLAFDQEAVEFIKRFFPVFQVERKRLQVKIMSTTGRLKPLLWYWSEILIHAEGGKNYFDLRHRKDNTAYILVHVINSQMTAFLQLLKQKTRINKKFSPGRIRPNK